MKIYQDNPLQRSSHGGYIYPRQNKVNQHIIITSFQPQLEDSYTEQ